MHYKTQMEAAKAGIITEQVKVVAGKENLVPEVVMERVANGTVVIPANINHVKL